MEFRGYGTTGPTVVALHGGPGAPGHMAPIARGLADAFVVLEPFQRGSGGEPLTVARHVEDLRGFISEHAGGAPPALVGASWGAMLALMFALAHPDLAGPLVLIGCGTFDPEAAAQLHANLRERTGAPVMTHLRRFGREHADPDDALRALVGFLTPHYSHDLVSLDLEYAGCDARAHFETWEDMERLRMTGDYPAAFAALRQPVLMLHGAVDPHPGRMIRDGLLPHVPQLRFVEWERCGHYPWLEREARDEFFVVLRSWLGEHLA